MQIAISDLSFGYDENTIVLNNLNLNCNNNHTIALVGASGCGKSTFLRLCCGILHNVREQEYTELVKENFLTSQIS